LPADVTRGLLNRLSPEELKSARALLGYPANTAGRYMTPHYVSVPPEMTAAEAINHIRRTGRNVETLDVVFLVDAEGKQVEDLRLGSLVLADPATKVRAIADPELVTIKAMADREEVLRIFEKYDRIALPVVDDDDKMLGIITSSTCSTSRNARTRSTCRSSAARKRSTRRISRWGSGRWCASAAAGFRRCSSARC
jgi:magnesium transporter